MNTPKNIIRIIVLVISLFVLGGLLLVGYTAIALPGCVTCHIAADKDAGASASDMAKVAMEYTPHKDVACIDCHVGTGFVPRVSFGVQETFSMMIPLIGSDSFDAPSSYEPRCMRCHTSLEGTLENNGIKIKHSSCAVEDSCVACHKTTAHRTKDGPTGSYTMDGCYSCHSSLQNSKDCTLCHADKGARTGQTNSSWAVTHGPNWETTHGMGNLDTCATCHKPETCVKCHGTGVPHTSNFFNLHGAAAKDKGQNCVSCHKPKFCSDCHNGFDMPHPKGFLQKHSSIAKNDKDPSCLKCHSINDCNGCHAAHVHPGGAIGTISSSKGGAKK